MFKHIAAYRFKVLLRDKGMLFWMLVFPVILVTLFRFTIANLGAADDFQPVDVAIVGAEQTIDDTAFMEVMGGLSKGEGRLFNMQTTDEAGAKALLEDGKIDGYILLGAEKELIVSRSGIEQSIIKSFLDQYLQSVSAVERIASINPAALPQALAALQTQESFTRDEPITRADPDTFLLLYYSLLAMTCLFGGNFGVGEVNAIQANLSAQAVRLSIAPAHKLKLFLSNLAVACTIQFVILLLLLAYMVIALSVDFGARAGLVVLTIFFGTITGVSFGAFISALIKGGEGIKIGIVVGASNLGAFLAGMMPALDIKQIVAEHVPVLAYLNPVNLLADAFYALYYFDTYTRYIQNIFGLTVFTVIFCAATYFVIRRQKYAGI